MIGLSYTPDSGSPVYNILFKEFTSRDLPRSYLNNAAFSNSANGTVVLAGPAFRQKYAWAIDCHLTKADAIELRDLFEAWDADRANGLPVACGLTDETFGATINTSVLITTPPTFSYYSQSLVITNIGLTEV